MALLYTSETGKMSGPNAQTFIDYSSWHHVPCLGQSLIDEDDQIEDFAFFALKFTQKYGAPTVFSHEAVDTYQNLVGVVSPSQASAPLILENPKAKPESELNQFLLA